MPDLTYNTWIFIKHVNKLKNTYKLVSLTYKLSQPPSKLAMQGRGFYNVNYSKKTQLSEDLLSFGSLIILGKSKLRHSLCWNLCTILLLTNVTMFWKLGKSHPFVFIWQTRVLPDLLRHDITSFQKNRFPYIHQELDWFKLSYVKKD